MPNIAENILQLLVAGKFIKQAKIDQARELLLSLPDAAPAASQPPVSVEPLIKALERIEEIFKRPYNEGKRILKDFEEVHKIASFALAQYKEAGNGEGWTGSVRGYIPESWSDLDKEAKETADKVARNSNDEYDHRRWQPAYDAVRQYKFLNKIKFIKY